MKHVKGRHLGTTVEAGRHLHEFMRLDADVISALAFHKPAAKRPCNGLMAEAGADHRDFRPVTVADEFHQSGKPWQAVIKSAERAAGDQKPVLLVGGLRKFAADRHIDTVAEPRIQLVEQVTEPVRIIGKAVTDVLALVVVHLKDADAQGCHL